MFRKWTPGMNGVMVFFLWILTFAGFSNLLQKWNTEKKRVNDYFAALS